MRPYISTDQMLVSIRPCPLRARWDGYLSRFTASHGQPVQRPSWRVAGKAKPYAHSQADSPAIGRPEMRTLSNVGLACQDKGRQRNNHT